MSSVFDIQYLFASKNVKPLCLRNLLRFELLQHKLSSVCKRQNLILLTNYVNLVFMSVLCVHRVVRRNCAIKYVVDGQNIGVNFARTQRFLHVLVNDERVP
jgi:hypothetical protein